MFKAPLVFNDLSLIEADSVDTARYWFTETLSAVAQFIHQRICVPILYARQDFHEILLTDEYGFKEWLDELDYQDELRLLAQQLTTQTPPHACLTEIEDFRRSEFRLHISPQKACDALGIALISDGISISFPSQSPWNTETFIIIEQVLYDNELNPEKTLQHRVRSVSQIIHIESVVRDWRRSIGEQSRNVEGLLERWETAFPYLDLCCEYRNKFLPLSGKTFKSVLKRLHELDESCYIWNTEKRKEIVYLMFARPESTETMRRKRLAEMRLATCPHCGEQYFEMHCDLQPSGYRLYWFVDHERRRLTIGYAGPHLETFKCKSK